MEYERQKAKGKRKLIKVLLSHRENPNIIYVCDNGGAYHPFLS